MAEPYIIYGSENSPYSIKVRSYAIYKNIPHKWVVKSMETQEEYQKVAKLPLVPAVRIPGTGKGMQDSTPIMEYFDKEFPNSASAHPSDKTLRFISELLEEFGDEWGNKWMFHYRWRRPIDQRIVAFRAAAEMLGNNSDEDTLVSMSDMIRARMSGRGFAVGSNDITAPMIEQSFIDGISQLETHLQARKYLLGSKPCFGDFGLAAQIYQALIDPSAGALLRNQAPRVVEWCVSLLHPSPPVPGEGKWESWEELAPTLEPFLKDQVGGAFLLWMEANSEAITTNKKECSVTLAYGEWKNKVGGPQKYQHKSLKVLRGKYERAAAENAKLVDIMTRTGCHKVLGNTASKL